MLIQSTNITNLLFDRGTNINATGSSRAQQIGQKKKKKKKQIELHTNPRIFNTSILNYKFITLSLQHIYFVNDRSSVNIRLNRLRNTHTPKLKQFQIMPCQTYAT